MRTSLALITAIVLAAPAAHAARLKDLVTVEGFRSNHLVGLGLVVGLDGTGDRPGDPATRQATANLLRHLGNQVAASDIRARNVALVTVTGELGAFMRPGIKVDVTISSAGSATSLQGGTLLSTPLKAVNGKIYAFAQGQLTVGGFEVESNQTGSFFRKNHVTVARIPGGATIERGVPQRLPEEKLHLLLNEPDFTTASRIEAAIESTLGSTVAEVLDPGLVEVKVSGAWKGRVIGLLATLESVEAVPDAPARVIVDERTGTVVAGGGLTLGPAAVAYGGLEIRIQERFGVSQPQPFAQGDTVVIPESEVQAEEKGGKMVALSTAATLADVAAALNALNVKPRDLIAILQALRAAGALRAEVRVL
ncbi:MAG: flagellar basal body P-ring protein FlgI [Deltaproteobacteria bacterium]|nr:flagellar basal body P-ring protein FlgI [Deltaproteobacteria bacterium]